MRQDKENTTKLLINRIHRIKGQLDAVEKGLANDTMDCEKTLLILKAASQAIKKFGEAYVQEYMDRCVIENNKKLDLKNVKTAIKAAFFF
ncbi:metal-sensitive transcriptional regulator [Leptospira kmetyi]|uniref:Metal-sensitive transcriptional regulator n=1 Tax=Leptospira kmetyi TaxID=408139 RepID=A0A2M9XQT3_9LEPT|nr:metal-sensitive transcriptional regulator [Leptospira kmetyi]AYV57724.1 metal-sensitive transcriptional regulator [Leptospira kmetyi]EQA55730.1 metal-sensitive transcriptional repressor [Leptospira kmetyi serovar Malaysia str. Bejo-Iso9]PJZ29650.1 metal-sensitive transcriptional repressor [Leptospira kmetyi]PJZ41669.1 metal-sensitive transcriptional repressor [Leptospira kmetyi]TGK23097.1 metal-sensitive transcriptional regulator [Leptospira kmetyi]